ncbi:MAG: TRAM domain-containing protein [Candidatus Micrarchaeaceae archaeon]
MDAAVRTEGLVIDKPAKSEAMGVSEPEMPLLNAVEEGGVYSMTVKAKDARGVGIGKIGNFVVFVKNAKTRIGNIYKVRVIKVHRTFAYAELASTDKQFIGDGSFLEL